MSNDILMYRTINKEMHRELNIIDFDMKFSYIENNKIVNIELEDQDNMNAFYMGKSKQLWDPSNNNLIIERSFTIEKPDILFGKNGITTYKGKLGLGVHIYSRSSNFQTTIILDEIITKKSDTKSITFKHEFEAGEIKGDIYFKIFLYLKNEIEHKPMFATVPGIRLGEVDNFKITVDGDGSVFPIIEVEKPGEPLWNVSTDWTDINDPFDTNNVRIEINRKHSMHNYLYKSTKPSRYLLVEVLSNAIAQIIFKVIQDDDFKYEEDSIPDSIRSIIEYWIETFEIDISSLRMISYSLRGSIEELFI